MNGVIFYNIGQKMLVRLGVAIHSLRKHYSGKATVLVDSDSNYAVREILSGYDINVKVADFPTLDKNTAYLNSCLSHTVTPYKNSLWIDSDCLVVGPFNELFDIIDKHHFVVAQFSDWTSYKGLISKRIKAWRGICPELIDDALVLGPGINCGVYGFSKRSTLVKDWYSLAVKGSRNFIPDEVCCQLLLPQHKHYILDCIYNTSCKFGKITDDTRIIHFHGRKHCRINDKGEYLFNSHLWYKTFDEVRDRNCIIKWIDKDKQLNKYLKVHDEKTKK